MDYQEFRALRMFPSLDGLRCLCIIPVVFHHTAPSKASQLLARGFLGVDMFFIISGFLIVTLLLRERDQRGEFLLRKFYIRRALRIMPLYYGIVILLTLAFATIASNGSQANAFFGELPYYATFTSNWIQAATMFALAWSLAAEEQFYLLWPPVEKIAARPIPIILALIFVSQLIQFHELDSVFYAIFGRTPLESTMFYQSTFSPMLFGVLLAHLLHERRSYELIAPLFSFRFASLGFLSLLLLSIIFMPEDLKGLPRPLLQLLMTLLLASCVICPNHILGRLLDQKQVKRIGAISYGIYLLHMFAMYIAEVALSRLDLTQYLLFPVTLALAIAMAEISYRYYEQPFLRLKSRVA